MVFLATGNPAPDYDRPNEIDMAHYGSSVVALRASTGEVLWNFNTVMKDHWDFDVPTKPVIEVEYRDVPRHGPLKDKLSPVQPFPLAVFQVSRIYEKGSSLLGLCDELDAASVAGPVFTPITEEWTIGLPSNMGATNWGGVSVDEARGLIAVNTNSIPFRTKLIWRRPHGTVREIAKVPLNWGVPGMGGSLITATGLVFIGAAAENTLRAYDIDSGDELWQHRLPNPGNATPMSYIVRTERGDRQFVVIAAGGDARGGIGGVGDWLVAFARPNSDRDLQPAEQ